MADTNRETIMAAIAVLLAAGGKPTGLTVERGRRRILEPDSLPWCGLSWTGETLEEGDHDESINRILDVEVEFRIQGNANESGEETLDPYLSWGERAVLASRRLGGLAVRVKLSAIDRGGGDDELEEPYAGAKMLFSVEYETLESNPETGTS